MENDKGVDLAVRSSFVTVSGPPIAGKRPGGCGGPKKKHVNLSYTFHSYPPRTSSLKILQRCIYTSQDLSLDPLQSNDAPAACSRPTSPSPLAPLHYPPPNHDNDNTLDSSMGLHTVLGRALSIFQSSRQLSMGELGGMASGRSPSSPRFHCRPTTC